MRYAQTGNTGYLPNEALPLTFSAQAYDLGDPCSNMDNAGYRCVNGSNVQKLLHAHTMIDFVHTVTFRTWTPTTRQGGNAICCSNRHAGAGGWPCEAGAQPHTRQYMGSLHPRIKQLVGSRLAKAARVHVYGIKGATTDSNGHAGSNSSLSDGAPLATDDLAGADSGDGDRSGEGATGGGATGEAKGEVWTGPVLIGCTAVATARQDTTPNITLHFEGGLLGGDAVMVMDPTSSVGSVRVDIL
jgi:hypothetical protein